MWWYVKRYVKGQGKRNAKWRQMKKQTLQVQWRQLNTVKRQNQVAPAKVIIFHHLRDLQLTSLMLLTTMQNFQWCCVCTSIINSWNSPSAWNQPSESKHMLTFAPTNQGLISQRIPLQFSNSTRHLMDLSKHWMNTTRKIYMENTKWQQELSESTKKRNPPRCTRMTSSGFPKTL